MDSLSTGGAERSLVTLLNQIHERYEIDLYLFRTGGEFQNQLPPSIRVLNPPPEYEAFNKPFLKSCRELLSHGHPVFFFYRCLLSLRRKIKKSSGREWSAWPLMSKVLPAIPEHYDTAVGYLEKQSVYFAIDKVQADKKIGWIHTDYKNLKDIKFDHQYYLKLDRIVAVSKPCADAFLNCFPNLDDKITVFENLIDTDKIKAMAEEPFELVKQPDTVYIATVARLIPEKGIDSAINACKILLKLGYPVRWLVAGDGPERPQLEELIRRLHIKREFSLLGTLRNPYALMKNCDLYVQPSKVEGFGLTVVEALTLNKPVIAFDIPAFRSLIENERNGLLMKNNCQSLVKGIMKLIDNRKLYDELSANADSRIKDINQQLFALDGIL